MADVLPPAPIDSPFGSVNWVDWYQKVRTTINKAQVVDFTAIANLPTDVSGYGITDAVFIASGQLTVIEAVSNGAAAATATMTNAPVAGNPTKWIPFNDNGTVRYIPAW